MILTIDGVSKTLAPGTGFLQLANRLQSERSAPIVLAEADGQLRELRGEIWEGADIHFITSEEAIGRDTYNRSCSMLFFAALYKTARIRRAVLHYSVGSGYYYTVQADEPVDEGFISRVEARMREMVREQHLFYKRSVRTQEAIRLFEKKGFSDKARLFSTRIASAVNIYSLDGYEDYNYGYMVPHTGCLSYFKLLPYHEGILLLLPDRQNPTGIPAYTAEEKLFAAQWEGEMWAAGLGIDTIGGLNARIIAGNSRKTILIAEAKQEARIAEIASRIRQRGSVRFVLVAGPSSSGKTTFSQRLMVQLEAQGLMPHYIGVDNYFIPRDLIPAGRDGQKDFESLSALDVECFNADMTALLEGKEVRMPTYDFISGKRVYKGETIRLGGEDVLVIEGIHCLNDELTKSLPKESKFKVYISALTQLNVDEHNRVPSRDGRLIRRIIRDHRTRGYSAASTINMWEKVRQGEENYIFPYQETADVFFNSALPYELAVLKPYVLPLLFGIGPDDAAYLEARRLLKFLDYFLPLPPEDVPTNSILREFIGGGCFRL
ncbi:MAG: nucleoside kinase [Lachnospiraceae bacterium]|nr:nucleoside kinase [Lachnospiraceae bacterium]